MRNLVKNKKRKGFTLIEMVAVVAIIGILAAILVPKITGYIKEAKKTAVIDAARKVTQSFEAAEMKGTFDKTATNQGSKANIEAGTVENAVANNNTMKSLLDWENASADYAILNGANVKQCNNITKGADFTIDNSDKLQLDSVASK